MFYALIVNTSLDSVAFILHKIENKITIVENVIQYNIIFLIIMIIV